MSKDQLLQEFADAYEKIIKTASEVAQHGNPHNGATWGPREVIAHLAGWEVMATVRIPAIVAGMQPLEETDEAREAVMNDAINATIVTMTGNQTFEAICDILRQAYQHDIEILKNLDDRFFQSGEYVYERTKSAIEHCQEHGEELVLNYS